MAVLERLNWNKAGFMTIREIINETLERTGIRYLEIEEHISTKISRYGTENILDAVSVNLSNFYDEDGEAMSMREVLDGTLRPFGLRLIQKGGKIVVYDLNDIYTSFEPEAVVWDSDDSVFGVDKVYNNVKVSFSPYESMELLKGEVDPDSVPGEGMSVLVDCTKGSTGAMTSPLGFKIAYSDTGKGVVKSDLAKYFRIDPNYSGEACAGIAWTITVKNAYDGDIRHLEMPTPSTGQMLFKIEEKAYLGNIGYKRTEYKLKLTMSLLFDPRYNPYEEATDQNYKKAFENLKNRANYAYVPFILTLRDAEGNGLYHWENKGVKDSRGYGHTASNCKWVSGEGTWGDAWMCWYQGNRENETGLGGWQVNKQIIGYYRGDLPVLFDKMDMAEYIDMPAVSGYLELQIGTGVPCYDYKSDTQWQIKQAVYDECRWVLYRDPAITLVNKYGKSIQSKDMEHWAWINKDAKEELKIETVLGTLDNPSPSAKGQIYKTSDKSVISELYRAGVTDHLERLLIGTVYSNYASRHNTLSGTAVLSPAFCTYTDNNEPGKYIMLSETQHLCDDACDLLIARFDADNYEGVEFGNETV